MARLLALAIGYVCGNFLAAMVVGKILLQRDPTKYGSGNPGTANMGAVFGKKYGILTASGDLLKTAVALLVVALWLSAKVNLAYAGLGLILGHCFPVWNHFRGGKGVAVAALVSVAYNWQAGFSTLLVALVLTAAMQNLTIPPLVFMLLFSCYVTTQAREAGIVFLIMTLVMAWQFRKDIVDFFAGRGKKVDILYTIKKKLGIKVNWEKSKFSKD